ncbi:MAG TPA: methyltransferase domain-containing protein [Chitinophagaceae bacterium]|nr:methyltransferase domain-containing protein [Chitinophagaceae bacterium]
MTYTIEETDLERQHLLAEFLNLLSLKVLSTIPLPQHARILDIGCGLGDTTLMLDERFPNSIITGLDGDASLIEAAIEEKKLLRPNLNFVCSDALYLPFEDNCFDFVFTRYCLQHIPEALTVLQEMKRVCKPSGIVFAQEPDSNSYQSYPEGNAYPIFKEMVNTLFADAIIGRKLIHYFKSLQLKNIQHNTQSILADHNSVIKKFYHMTGEAMSKSILQNKLMNEEEFDEWIKELERIEHDENTIVLIPPSIAVWATKAEAASSNYIYQHEK